jgi:NAD(P)-dependent dehydrogenase (short-subunit alcohol dehydrogenase family)
LGVDIAKAALAAGHAVVATGRDAAKVLAAVGERDELLTITLDVTHPPDAQAAVEAAVAKFGRIDVLVNNAGNFFAGFFEELSPEQVRNQIETLLFGPMNVTRAALPVMRKQRSGLLVTISSTAGIAGQMFCTAKLAALREPPARFAAGSDAVQIFEAKANTLLVQARAHHELSTSLALEEA